MATAISKANFEAALGECYDAIIAKSWEDAWMYYAAAEAQLAGLESQAGAAGEYYRLRDSLDGLKNALEAAEQKVGRKADTDRLMGVQTGFPGSRR